MRLHVDIDAFYASVEQRDNPQLQALPVIVGAQPGNRGVVSSCSYEARRYGVKSAMPISEAYRRCPQGVYLPVRMKRYALMSGEIMDLLRQFSPDFQQISIDEAFLDLTGTHRLYGPPDNAARMLKAAVKDSMGLTVSVGVAPNRYVAKLASEYAKPDGLHVVEEGDEQAFIDMLHLRDLWGVGAKTLARLDAAGIRSVRDLRGQHLLSLTERFGPGAGRYLYSVVRGIDPGIHPSRGRGHSLSAETTFGTDTADAREIRRAVLDLSHDVAARLLEGRSTSRTVVLKLRTHDFTTTTVRRTVKHAVASAEEVYSIALGLLEEKWDSVTPVRLIGVGVVNPESSDGVVQLELFGDQYERKRRVEAVVKDLKERLCGVRITKGSLLETEEE